MRCAIWYHLYDLKNVKNNHGEVLFLVKLQAKAYNSIKVTLIHGCFPRFLNCTNGTKLRKASYLLGTHFSHSLPISYGWFLSTALENIRKPGFEGGL